MTPRERFASALRPVTGLIRRTPVKTAADLRKPQVLAGLAVIVALVVGGVGVATVSSRGGSGSPDLAAVRSAGDDRANRDFDRTSTSPSPSVSDSPSPSVTPTTASPTPALTSAKPTPSRTTTKPKPKTTTPAPLPPAPASCASYTGNQLVACQLLPSFGFSTGQMSSLVPLWNKESGWRVNAANSSGAYGIPQALPGSKMGTVASDWRTNPATQIKWGLGYIKGRYGSPAAAWSYWRAHGWY